MEAWLQTSLHGLLAALALPEVGLPAIWLISLVSATLLPLGSEPAVFAYVQLVPHMFWPAVLVATVGNTMGGVISYAMGAGAEKAYIHWRQRGHAPAPDVGHKTANTSDLAPPQDIPPQDSRPSASPPAGGRWHRLSQTWFRRLGPPALLLSWLPGIGDPLCAVAGWLRLPFWPCVLYMAIGKCLRYVVMTAVLMHAWPQVSAWFGL